MTALRFAALGSSFWTSRPLSAWILATVAGDADVIVSGDDDLLTLSTRIPTLRPRQFLEKLPRE